MKRIVLELVSLAIVISLIPVAMFAALHGWLENNWK
jgi:hypothetical protein